MINIQVGAPKPVLNRNQGNIVAASAEYCRYLQQALRIDCAIRSRLRTSAGQYSHAVDAVQVYSNHLLPAAEKALKLVGEAPKLVEQDFIQLLVSRQTCFDSNLAYIDACAPLATSQALIDAYLLTNALNSVINGSVDDTLRGSTVSQD